jgi:hypothetical protein
MSVITSDPTMVGKVVTIEELSQMDVVKYEGGASPRGRTVARRLKPILELLERGPNGSLGIGAIYRIKSREVAEISSGRSDIDDNEISVASDWLQESIERMTKGK